MRFAVTAVTCVLTLTAMSGATPRADGAVVTRAPAPARELIVVYLGLEGTNSGSEYQAMIRDMKDSLALRGASEHRGVVTRGVSLEPSVAAGLRDLANFGAFDEVSVGGNWTNSSVVRYLGPTIGRVNPNSSIPQIVLLEREIVGGDATLQVGPEREIGRLIGKAVIIDWLKRGSPVPVR